MRGILFLMPLTPCIIIPGLLYLMSVEIGLHKIFFQMFFFDSVMGDWALKSVFSLLCQIGVLFKWKYINGKKYTYIANMTKFHDHHQDGKHILPLLST